MTYKLKQGDCLDKLTEVADSSVQLIVTSPPYFNARSYSQFPSYDAYLHWSSDWIGESCRVLCEGRMVCINVSSVLEPRISRSHRSSRHNIPADIASICRRLGLWFVEDIVWEKPLGAAIGRNRRFHVDRSPLAYKCNSTTERILVYQKPTKRLNDVIIRANNQTLPDSKIGEYEASDVWRVSPVRDSKHPAPYPIQIPTNLINYYSWKTECVLDPFMGSGTTGVACMNTNRRFIGIEQDEKYFQIAKGRIEAAASQDLI